MTLSIPDMLMMRQKDIELEFAAIVNQFPVYALQQCGWLNQSIIVDERVRKYWGAMRGGLDGAMDDDAAMSVSMQAALESDIGSELSRWGRGLDMNAAPQAYAQEISRRAYLTKVGSIQGDLWRKLQASDDIGIRELIAEIAEYGTQGAPSSMPYLMDLHEEFVKLANDGQRSIPTFITPLDQSIGGMERKTLTVLAGRPSMGKSALGMQIARNVANSGKHVIFFSLEMSSIGLWARIACPLAKVQWRDVLANRLNLDQQRELREQSKKIAEQLKDTLTIIDTRQTTESIWRTVAVNKPDLLVLDNFHYVKTKGEKENKRQGAICESLHDLAKGYDIPVLLLVQLNRGVEKQQDKRPQMADLRDSGEIEETADNILMLYREGYYNPTSVPLAKDPTELWLRKFRNGPAGIPLDLLFQ